MVVTKVIIKILIARTVIDNDMMKVTKITMKIKMNYAKYNKK